MSIKRLKEKNLSMLIDLAWSLLNDKTLWTQYTTWKYLNRDREWSYNKSSPVCNGIKWALKDIREKHEWIIGNVNNINIWKDNWMSHKPLCKLINPCDLVWRNVNSKLYSIMLNNTWSWPTLVTSIAVALNINLKQIPPPNQDE